MSNVFCRLHVLLCPSILSLRNERPSLTVFTIMCARFPFASRRFNVLLVASLSTHARLPTPASTFLSHAPAGCTFQGAKAPIVPCHCQKVYSQDDDGLINQWRLVAEEANSQAYYIYHYHKLKLNTNIIMVNARFL